MDELKKVIEEYAKQLTQYRAEVEKTSKDGQNETAEVKAMHEKMEKSLEAVEERMEKLQASVNRPESAGEMKAKDEKESKVLHSAFIKTLSGRFSLDDEEKEAFSQHQKSMLLADETSLGFLAPTEFVAEVLRDVIEMSPIRSLATVRTITGKSIQQPKINDAETIYWLDEQALPTSEDFDSELLSFPAHVAGALRSVSQSGLEDIAYLEAELRASFARTFAKGEGTAFISGSGIKRPEGILENSDVSETTSSVTNQVSFDDLISLEASIKEPYLPNATWLMNRATKGRMRKIKDTNGQYIWSPSVAVKEAPTILGYPVVLCPDLANVATAAQPIIFGDIRAGYKIVDRVGMTVQVMLEKYAPLVGFLARKRLGGQVQLPEALGILTIK